MCVKTLRKAGGVSWKSPLCGQKRGQDKLIFARRPGAIPFAPRRVIKRTTLLIIRTGKDVSFKNHHLFLIPRKLRTRRAQIPGAPPSRRRQCETRKVNLHFTATFSITAANPSYFPGCTSWFLRCHPLPAGRQSHRADGLGIYRITPPVFPTHTFTHHLRTRSDPARFCPFLPKLT